MPVLLIATVLLTWFVFFCWYPLFYMLPNGINDAIFKHKALKDEDSNQTNQ